MPEFLPLSFDSENGRLSARVFRKRKESCIDTTVVHDREWGDVALTYVAQHSHTGMEITRSSFDTYGPAVITPRFSPSTSA